MNKAFNALGKTLVLIPAKAGSVRLPGKNVRKFLGVSLLGRAIKRAQNLPFIDRICVSTEDEEVADEARKFNVDIPFMRPEVLSKDPAGVVEVALHALEWFELHGEAFDTLIILLPTSPFCKTADIEGAINVYVKTRAKFLMSVSREIHSPFSSLILDDGWLSPLHPDWLNKTGARATGLTPISVRSNGAVTIVDVQEFIRTKNYYSYPLAAYEMPLERSIDIDTEIEFQFAEFLAERNPSLAD